ncbi:MAG TPA: hypothetical protein VK181_10055 [Rhizobium sp.]|nr:hypothetical protein [Rhizobium sp.]
MVFWVVFFVDNSCFGEQGQEVRFGMARREPVSVAYGAGGKVSPSRRAPHEPFKTQQGSQAVIALEQITQAHLAD